MKRVLFVLVFLLLLSAPVLAACGSTIALTGAGCGAPSSAAAFATYTQTDNPAVQNAPGSSTVTFTGANIGTAASNRVVVLIFSSTGQVATAATVGGVGMTKAVEESSVASGLQIWYGTVASGATANVVLSFGGNPGDCTLVVGKFNSGASTTPTDTQSTASGLSATQTLNTTIPSGGFAVMGVIQQHALQTATWTNMTAVGGDTSQATTNDSGYTAHSTTAGSPTALGFLVPVADIVHSVSASWGP